MNQIMRFSQRWTFVGCLLALALVGLVWRFPSFHQPAIIQQTRKVQSTSTIVDKQAGGGGTGRTGGSWNNKTDVGSWKNETDGGSWVNGTGGEWNITFSPTSFPTESPAPSPAPSDVPTLPPTGTAKPTITPTAAPTESPAPSPAPSETPSLQPTTTPYPTAAPTVSSPPSQNPSSQPSNRPSLSPSTRPSSSPTFVGIQTSLFRVRFPLPHLLTETEQDAFVQGTEEWIPQANVGEDSALSQPVVKIHNQTMVKLNKERELQLQRRRQLQTKTTTEESETKPSSIMLQIEFQVTVVYKGSDMEFNLYLALNPLFQLPDPLWIHTMGNYNDLFLQLRPSSTIPPALITDSHQSGMGNLTSAGIVVIVVVIVAAMGMGIAAVAVGVREYKLAMHGKEFHSPQGDGVGFFEEEGNNEVESMLPLSIPPQPLPEEHVAMHGNNLSTESYLDHHLPTEEGPIGYYESTNENDNPYQRGPRDDSLGEIFRGHNIYGRTGSDPPTANSEAGAPTDYNNMRRRALMDDNTRSSSKHRDSSEMSHEILLTKSLGGTLGAKEFPTSPSDYTSSQLSSYYTNSMAAYGKNQRRDTGSGTLGARPLRHEEVPHPLRSNPSFDSSVVPRAGLYDVFAPAGPIGIIVDTTKDGPAVHSLKANSPMRGLINPGDLIVALDDKDTRGMTAATLTRLMAKKANQKERKITLLATDQY